MKRLYIFSFLMLFSIVGFSQSFIYNNGIKIVNSANLTVNGDWVNDAGTSIKNDGIIATSENWTNNGTLDAASTGGFVLNFATDKTFTPGGSNFGFLSKQGTGNADITGQFSVKDSLSIKGGVITPLTSTDILTVAETGTVSSVPGSFLEGGNLVRKGTGNLFFPVGKNGVALPITFLKVSGTNPSVSVTVEDAPAGYSAGAGVDSLVNFPYVWKAIKTNVADTATYVELEYPNTLPLPVNAIVVKKVSGQNKYEGMGKRAVTNSGGVVKIRSYSKALQGIFSVAAGFAGNLETDSLALVALFDGSNGNAWTKKTNWKSGKLIDWQGVTQTGSSITSLILSAANINGTVPDEVADILALQTVNLSGNGLTRIPDFSKLTALTSLDVSNNKLDFSSLEANAAIAGVSYASQADLSPSTKDTIPAGTPYSLKIPTGGTANAYQWKKNGTAISGATTDQYDIAAIGRSTSGTYVLEVTNTLVPGLVLTSGTRQATAVANISGKLSVDANTPVTKGEMMLLKINPTGQLYEKKYEKDIGADGSYAFENVVLDDYVLLGQADTILFDKYFPTYFNGSVFWEEADTIRLNNNVTDLNYNLVALPTVQPKGVGEIFGIFETEIPGGRVENRGRVSGASATVRRATNAGRPDRLGRTMAGDVIVAFLYTNENGEFDFTNLEEGSYLLNIQYPGVPMDPKSDVLITIGPKDKKENIQNVDALAIGGKIVATRHVIVGVSEEEQNAIQIYPNPVTKDLFINLEEGGGIGEMKLFDTSGKEILSSRLAEGHNSADLSQISEGIYILKVYKNTRQVTEAKIVIEK